jgi:hypothetical protein
MMDLTGLEPATSRVANEVPGLFTTGGKGLAGNGQPGRSFMASFAARPAGFEPAPLRL